MKPDKSQYKKWLLCFSSPYTGKAGKGKPLSKELAAAWLEHSKREFPDLKHDILPALDGDDD